MILQFEFKYTSTNRVLENLLVSICKDFNIEFKLSRASKYVILLLVRDEIERLEKFSNYLSDRLPLSIFFKSTTAKVVDSFEVEEIEVKDVDIVLPFTPKVFNSNRLFINNEVGKKIYSDDVKVIFQGKSVENFDEMLKNIKEFFISNGQMTISSASGEFTYGILNESFKEKNIEYFEILPTDLSVIQKMVVAKENEITTLATLEKPIIEFRLNTLYKEKGMLNSNRVKIKLADEILIFKIFQELFNDGVEFIYRFKANEKVDLKIEGILNTISKVEVVVLENDEILIVKGDSYSGIDFQSVLKKFETPSYGQFASVLQEHDLFDKKVSCFYLSKIHSDLLMHLSEKTGMLKLVEFPVMRDFRAIFDEIEKSDTGKRLVKNYKKTFPELYDNILNTKISKSLPDSIYSIWGIVAVILGISTSVEEGSRKIVELSDDFGGLKGPRIDYKLIEETSIYNKFDMIKLIRSSMSFKLAGTDDKTLSFGLIEALSYFLSDMSDFCRNNLSAQNLVLCGSMFSIKKFCEISCKNLQPNIKIHFNRELPIEN